MRRKNDMFEMNEDRGSLAVAGGSVSAGADPYHDSAVQRLLRSDQKMCDGTLAFADRHRVWIWATVLLFYLAAFNGQWRMQSDAALYLSIGRNLAQGHGFTYLGQPEHLAYPGWPALIAVTFKVFGTKSLVPVHVVMLTIALLTIAAVYRMVLLHSGRPTAVVVAAGTGLTKAFFCYGFELWTDMPFALGAMTFFAGYEGVAAARRNPARTRTARAVDVTLLTGGLLIAAVTRPTVWPLLVAIVLTVCVHVAKGRLRWKPIVLLAVAAAIPLAVVIGSGRLRPGGVGFGRVYEQYLVNRLSGRSADGGFTHSFAQNVHDLFSWAASDVLFQTRLGPICNTLLSVLVLSLGFGLFRYRALWGFWFCLMLATILISQETLDRYFLPVLPLLIFAWWDFLVRLNRMLPVPWANLAFLGLVCFGGLMNLTKCAGIVFQQRQRPFLASYDQGIFDATPRFAEKLHSAVGLDAIILLDKPYGRVTAFLSERSVISALNTSVAELRQNPVYVVEPVDATTRRLLKSAGLVELPAMFTVHPSPGHGPMATDFSLHPTRPVDDHR